MKQKPNLNSIKQSVFYLTIKEGLRILIQDGQKLELALLDVPWDAIQNKE